MDKLYYPAIMHPEEEGGYSIWLSDIPGCVPQGETMPEAVENIKDALGLFYEDAVEGSGTLPAPAAPKSVELEPGEFVAVIEFSPGEYLKTGRQRL
jgi:predicted RNase H-like HicB family nuclease